MRKQLLSFWALAVALVMPVSLNAQEAEAATSYAGTCYVKNVGQQKYLSQGADWGTRAVLSNQLMPIEIVENEEGLYDLHVINVSNGGDSQWLCPVNSGDIYTDQGRYGWTFTEVEGGVTISKDGKNFGWNGTELKLVLSADVTGADATWEIIGVEEYNEILVQTMSQATAAAPVNATGYIQYPDFMRNNDAYKNYWQGAGSLGGNNDNYVMEHWNTNSNTYQEVTLPKGMFKLSVQGFYRYGNKADAIAQKAADGEPIVNAYLYAGEESAPMMSIFDNATLASDESIPNSMAEVSTAFSNGLYGDNALFFFLAEETTLNIGIKENEDVAGDWLIFDNFSLFYYGEEQPTQDDVVEILAQIPTTPYDPAIDSEVEEARAAVEAELTPVTYANLVAAVDKVKASAEWYAAQKPAIDAMYDLMASTNVYTAEAYEAYMALADEYFAQYSEGRLSSAVVNPNAVTGWRASTNYSQFLYSAWEEGTHSFDNPLYINTWSGEGSSDGSNFTVPFFEYWTGDGATLAARELTATVTGLTPGAHYTVSALTRVRLSDSSEEAPAGICLQAGDGEPVSVTAGENVAGSRFYLGNFAANGCADAEGTLTIKYIIEEGNNISWLSFKNVKYTRFEHTIDIDVERETGLGYNPTFATADLQAACELLGIETVADASPYIVNVTTGEYVVNSTDGWRNAQGDLQAWGPNAYVCVKFDTTVSEDNILICNMPNAEIAAGDSYTAKWALVTATDVVIFNINVAFVAPQEVGEVEVVKTITVNHNEAANTIYSGTTETFDVSAVTEALGIDDIAKAEQYIMNVTDGSLVKNTTDGWRNANGDAASWGNAGGVCVKIQDPASGEIDYIGCYDDSHNAGEVYTAKWAFVNEGKAVVVEVVITFVEGTGIRNVLNGEAGKLDVYTIQGRKVQGNLNQLPAGLYIVNGQKMIKK